MLSLTIVAAGLGQAMAHATDPHDHPSALAAERAREARLAYLAYVRAQAAAPTVVQAASAPEPPPQTYRQLSPQDAALLNASLPFSTLPNPAALPFKLITSDATDKARALDCLTMAVYYEAASESPEGQAAVAQVVLNRVRNPLFPKSVCAVVLQGSTLPTGCQFTFTCDGSLARRPTEAGWKSARFVAQRALNGYVQKSVGEATHYHTQWVVPYWQPTLVKLTQIGAHIFYRWSGDLGRPAAFRGQYAGAEQLPPQIVGFSAGAAPVELAVSLDAPAPAGAASTQTPGGASVQAVQTAMAAPPVVLTPAAVQLAQAQPAKRQSFYGRPGEVRQGAPVAW